MKINKTNAARLLDKAKIAYELIPYEVDENDLLGQSYNNPLYRFFCHILTDKVQKFMRGYSCQPVCNQLQRIAHSYPCALPSIIYSYYSAHMGYKNTKKTLPAKGNVSFILLFQLWIILPR